MKMETQCRIGLLGMMESIGILSLSSVRNVNENRHEIQ